MFTITEREYSMITNQFTLAQISSACIGRHIQALEGVRHPVTAPQALERAADYIAQTLRSLGYAMDEHLFTDDGRPFRNVIATRRGVRYPLERVVVLAHYDTVAGSSGADDNASGVAVLLEVARVLAQCGFERTVQFIGVNLEENKNHDDPCSGTRGSRALAAHARENGWDITGVLVLESVAYAGDGVVQTTPPGVPIPVPETGDFIAVVGNQASVALSGSFVGSLKRYQADLPHVVL